MISCEFDPGPHQELRVSDLITSMTLIIFHLSEGRLLKKLVVFSIRNWWEISTLVVPEMGASARFSYLRGVDVQVDRSYSIMHCEHV